MELEEAHEVDVVALALPEVEAHPEAEVDLEAIAVDVVASLDLEASLADAVLLEAEVVEDIRCAEGGNENEALAQALGALWERSGVLWRLLCSDVQTRERKRQVRAGASHMYTSIEIVYKRHHAAR